MHALSGWDPYHQGDVNKLEMIQHRAVRFVLNQPWGGIVSLYSWNHSIGQLYRLIEGALV